MREKALIIFLCVLGILTVSYGMVKDNDVVFIIGLFLVITGYVLIRRKLKKSAHEKS